MIANPTKIQNIIDSLGRDAPPGCIVEIGVFQGGSLEALAEAATDRKIYGYDTFNGMPKQGPLDNCHYEGEFQSDIEYVKSRLARFSNVKLIKGIYPFSDVSPPNEPIAIAHVDVDLYESTYWAMTYLRPRMAKGGRIWCDDAFMETCHGATLAMCRFCAESGLVPRLYNGSFYVDVPTGVQ